MANVEWLRRKWTWSLSMIENPLCANFLFLFLCQPVYNFTRKCDILSTSATWHSRSLSCSILKSTPPEKQFILCSAVERLLWHSEYWDTLNAPRWLIAVAEVHTLIKGQVALPRFYFHLRSKPSTHSSMKITKTLSQTGNTNFSVV